MSLTLSKKDLRSWLLSCEAAKFQVSGFRFQALLIAHCSLFIAHCLLLIAPPPAHRNIIDWDPNQRNDQSGPGKRRLINDKERTKSYSHQNVNDW